MMTGVFAAQFVSRQRLLAQSIYGINDGIRLLSKSVHRHGLMGEAMALTDAFVRSAKSGDKTGAKYADVDGMYLLVTPNGKYWRLDYHYLGKRKTLALGTYPEVSLGKDRIRSGEARAILADGLDPADEKRKANR
jgi:hypothetical protein